MFAVYFESMRKNKKGKKCLGYWGRMGWEERKKVTLGGVRGMIKKKWAEEKKGCFSE